MTPTTSEADLLVQAAALRAAADWLAVLRVKDAVCRRPTYRRDVTSVDVYTAVLDHGVRTVEAFDAWRAARRPAG